MTVIDLIPSHTGVSPVRGRKLPAEVLTPDEVRGLIGACSTRARTGIRNRALIVVLWRTGLRLSEALALRPKDLDRTGGSIRVLHGKGDKARTVGLDGGAVAVVERWLDLREREQISARAPLFCTLAGKPVQTQYVRNLLPRLARKAGISKRVHAHGLRHTHACELAEEGVELRIISAQLGHANTSTTDRYLRHLAPQAVIEAMRGRTFNIEEK
jgi:site-specific recombinase XerD